MAKFLLAVLMVAMVSCNVYAKGVAGESPPATEPGIVSQIAETVDEGLMIAKGVLLGSQVKPGMTRDEVCAILGQPSGSIGYGSSNLTFFDRVGVVVMFCPDRCGSYITISPILK